MLDTDGFCATVEGTNQQEWRLREKLHITRPERDRCVHGRQEPPSIRHSQRST